MVNKNKYVLKYLCFLLLFLVGCSASSNQRANRLGSVDGRLLEERIDDLSGKINLMVNDANSLHNKVEEVQTSNKTIQQKIEGLEASVSNLNERMAGLTTAANIPEITQPPAEETDVRPQVTITDSSKSSEVPESDIQKTVNYESQLAVAKGFWDAMNAKDIQTVRSYATKESGDKLRIKDGDTATNCTVTFGGVKTEDNKTTIETAMKMAHGTTTSEVQMQTILVSEDGQWKVNADQTMMSVFGGTMGDMIEGLGAAMEEGLMKGMEEMGRSMAEGIQKGFEAMTQTSEAKPDTTPQMQETAVISEVLEQTEAEGTQTNTEEITQTGETKPDIIPPKEGTVKIGEIREQTETEGTQKGTEEVTETGAAKPDVTPPKQETAVLDEKTKREIFLKDNIVRLASAEFPDNKGIQWNILSIEHKAHLANVEAEPIPATLAYPRFKFVVSFKNPEMPRVIGVFCFKDGQYSLLDTKKR